MAQGIGDISGRAVRLQFPQQAQRSPIATGPRAPQQAAARQPIEDIVQAPEGIQLDQAGMYEAVYDGFASLKSFLVNARSKGIDPAAGIDPYNPASRPVVAEWNRAVAAYQQILERFQQGKANQDLLMQSYQDGTMFLTDDYLSGDTGVLSSEEATQSAFSQDPEFIKTANRYLAEQPASEDTYNDMMDFYNENVERIQELAANGSIPPEAEAYWIAKLRKPSRYVSDADDGGSGRKGGGKRSGGGDGGDGPPERLYPELSETVINFRKRREGGGDPTGKLYQDRSLGDQREYFFDSVFWDEDASEDTLVYRFTKRADPVEMTDDEYKQKVEEISNTSMPGTQEYNEAIRKLDAQREGKVIGDPIEIRVTEDNALSAWYATLNESDRRLYRKEIADDGGGPFDMTITGAGTWLGFDGGQEDEQGATKPSGRNSSPKVLPGTGSSSSPLDPDNFQ